SCLAQTLPARRHRTANWYGRGPKSAANNPAPHDRGIDHQCGVAALARISHTKKCIGRRISESSFATKTFRRFEGAPMTRDCSTNLFGFTEVEGREVVAAFDGGAITSDAGGLLLGAADRAIGLIDRFAACFHDLYVYGGVVEAGHWAGV